MTQETDENTILARERTLLANERTRLANERTFLAWTRSGLASVGGGLAILRLLVFKSPLHQLLAQGIGIALMLVGIAMFALSLFNYRISYEKLKVKKGYAGSVAVVSAISLVLIIASLLMLLLGF